jgi:hypothetical protein
MDNKLQKWINERTVGDEMIWKGAFGHQVGFVRDTICNLVGWGLDYEDKERIADVVSVHTSKSIVLPVYDLRRPDLGLRLVMRNNFYNWKLSVISKKPIIADFSGLFPTTPPVEPDYTGNPLSPVYFEGFPKELIFGYYETSDKKKWSAEIGGDYSLHTTIFLMLRSLDVVKPHQWHTRESHKKELEAETARHRAKKTQSV